MASLKLIFATLFLLGCYCTQTTGYRNNRDRGPKSNEYRPAGLAFSIIKPSSGSGYTSTAGDTCATECIMSIQNNNNEFMNAMSAPWFEEDEFNSTEMNLFCRAFDTFNMCLEQCDDSNLKAAFSAANKPITFMCNSTDYINSLSCFRDAYKEALSCSTNTCHEQEKLVSEGWISASFENLENITAYFDSQCNYYNCYVDCVRPTFVQKCTLDGFKAFKRATQLKVLAAKESFAALSQPYVEPASCTSFRNEDDDE